MAPPEAAEAPLEELVERPRLEGWTMASALTRYAQPQAELVGQVWQELRRVLWCLHAGSDLPAPVQEAVERAAHELDALGDVLVAWAVRGGPDRPDEQVAAAVREVAQGLDEAGVPHEPREGPPRGGGRAGRGV